MNYNKNLIISILILAAVLFGGYLVIYNKTETVNENKLAEVNTNWKTYRNDEYEFQFEYPGNWSVATSNDSSYVSNSDGLVLSFTFSDDVKASRIIDKAKGAGLVKAREIGGKQAYFNCGMSQLGCDDPIKDLIIFDSPQKGQVMFVAYHNNNFEIIDKVLSTFKFIK